MGFINLAANYSNLNHDWQDWYCFIVGGEQVPRDRVGFSEQIVRELICRKRWMIFLETGGTFCFYLWHFKNILIHFSTAEHEFFLYWLYTYSQNVIRGTSSFALVDTKYRMIYVNSSHRLLLDAFSTTWVFVWSVLLLYVSGAIQNLIVDWQSEKENTITGIGTMVLVGIWASLQRNLCTEFCFLRLFSILAAAHTIG